MAQMITTHIYRLEHHNRLGTPRLETLPVPFTAFDVPVTKQPATNAYVYSKVRWSLGNSVSGPIVEEAYSAETVAQLVAKANT